MQRCPQPINVAPEVVNSSYAAKREFSLPDNFGKMTTSYGQFNEEFHELAKMRQIWDEDG